MSGRSIEDLLGPGNWQVIGGDKQKIFTYGSTGELLSVRDAEKPGIFTRASINETILEGACETLAADGCQFVLLLGIAQGADAFITSFIIPDSSDSVAMLHPDVLSWEIQQAEELIHQFNPSSNMLGIFSFEADIEVVAKTFEKEVGLQIFLTRNDNEKRHLTIQGFSADEFNAVHSMDIKVIS